MRKLPSDMELLQKSCGTRVIYNGKSCIANITDKDMFDECLICSETKNQKIKDSIKYRPMDDNWKSRCKEEQFWFQDTLEDMKKLHPTMDDRLFDLRQKLLDFAGEAVCFPGYEEDLDNILNYGQFSGNRTKTSHVSVLDMPYLKMVCGASTAGLYGIKHVLIRL